jgi:hypothetical protein
LTSRLIVAPAARPTAIARSTAAQAPADSAGVIPVTWIHLASAKAPAPAASVDIGRRHAGSGRVAAVIDDLGRDQARALADHQAARRRRLGREEGRVDAFAAELPSDRFAEPVVPDATDVGDAMPEPDEPDGDVRLRPGHEPVEGRRVGQRPRSLGHERDEALAKRDDLAARLPAGRGQLRIPRSAYPAAVAADRSGAPLAFWLDDSEDVAAGVDEPGRPGMAHVGDAVSRDRVGRLVLLDPHAAAAQLVDRGMDIRDTPRHLGLGVLVPIVLLVTTSWVPLPVRKTIRSPGSSRAISSPSRSR